MMSWSGNGTCSLTARVGLELEAGLGAQDARPSALPAAWRGVVSGRNFGPRAVEAQRQLD